jgi:hypothetical protein
MCIQDTKDIKVLMFCIQWGTIVLVSCGQYAIQTGQRPEDTTSVNIDGGFDRKAIKSLGIESG